MITLDTPFLVSVLQIVWIDLLLSGDNAVVIALACRALPPRQRRIGMLLGAGTAVALRIVFALVVSWLLAVPLLRVVGGVLLLWIAVKLALGEDEDSHAVDENTSLWRAVRTIAVADAVMSLDNVVAIAAAAKGHAELFVFGLLLSIPLIVMGAALITRLLQQVPAIVWAGAGLLGWIAGEMLATDPLIAERLAGLPHAAAWAAAAGAFLVIAVAALLTRRRTVRMQASDAVQRG
ncbi:TerC family protein [Methylobacterium sp. J-090]|uniref:TerC family protein n=1 Tax=Methylobacterium sp. J-090 TaxID=2836666 RepID=UPI001FB95421|nr:TerC family protein [Methylobacterium sp. J-090]MCJ2083502.1 TerC family protein [Methylobacterium sp. J-090]